MRLSLFTLSSLSLLGTAAATDFVWYKTATNCAGNPYYTTYNAANAVCYRWANGGLTMSSVKFNNLPSGAKGQAYSSYGRCSSYAGETTRSGGCVSGANNLRTSNWFYPYKRLAIKRETKPTRHGVTYELPDGTIREVEVPLQQVEQTLTMVEEHDYEGLAKLPDMVYDD